MKSWIIEISVMIWLEDRKSSQLKIAVQVVPIAIGPFPRCPWQSRRQWLSTFTSCSSEAKSRGFWPLPIASLLSTKYTALLQGFQQKNDFFRMWSLFTENLLFLLFSHLWNGEDGVWTWSTILAIQDSQGSLFFPCSAIHCPFLGTKNHQIWSVNLYTCVIHWKAWFTGCIFFLFVWFQLLR